MSPPRSKLIFDLLTLKVVSESRGVRYLCANFSLPRPLCSRLRPDIRTDKQADSRVIAIMHSVLTVANCC